MQAVNVYYNPNSSGKNHVSKKELVDWVNQSLGSKLTKVEQMGTGAHYCQFFNILFPKAIPMNRVKLNSLLEYDHYQNFHLLQKAFWKTNCLRVIQINKLAKLKFTDNFEFLLWFQTFARANGCEEKLKSSVKPTSIENCSKSKQDKPIPTKPKTELPDQQTTIDPDEIVDLGQSSKMIAECPLNMVHGSPKFIRYNNEMYVLLRSIDLKTRQIEGLCSNVSLAELTGKREGRGMDDNETIESDDIHKGTQHSEESSSCGNWISEVISKCSLQTPVMQDESQPSDIISEISKESSDACGDLELNIIGSSVSKSQDDGTISINNTSSDNQGSDESNSCVRVPYAYVRHSSLTPEHSCSETVPNRKIIKNVDATNYFYDSCNYSYQSSEIDGDRNSTISGDISESSYDSNVSITYKSGNDTNEIISKCSLQTPIMQDDSLLSDILSKMSMESNDACWDVESNIIENSVSESQDDGEGTISSNNYLDDNIPYSTEGSCVQVPCVRDSSLMSRGSSSETVFDRRMIKNVKNTNYFFDSCNYSYQSSEIDADRKSTISGDISEVSYCRSVSVSENDWQTRKRIPCTLIPQISANEYILGDELNNYGFHEKSQSLNEGTCTTSCKIPLKTESYTIVRDISAPEYIFGFENNNKHGFNERRQSLQKGTCLIEREISVPKACGSKRNELSDDDNNRQSLHKITFPKEREPDNSNPPNKRSYTIVRDISAPEYIFEHESCNKHGFHVKRQLRNEGTCTKECQVSAPESSGVERSDTVVSDISVPESTFCYGTNKRHGFRHNKSA